MAYTMNLSKKKKPPNVNERVLKERVRKAQELLRDAKDDLFLYKNDFRRYMKKQRARQRSRNSILSPRLRLLLQQIKIP